MAPATNVVGLSRVHDSVDLFAGDGQSRFRSGHWPQQCTEIKGNRAILC